MISCIICSRNSDISRELKTNITSTIGCEYELVVVDNSDNRYSMFSAYNEGVSRAKGDILCFMHEDVFYYTPNWGRVVEEYFTNDINLGLLGILGSHYLAKCVCGVGDSSLISAYYYAQSKLYDFSRFFNTDGSVEVVVVDGMWFCIKKSLFFSEIRFDETFQGFHYYDMDICLQVLRAGYSCKVTKNVLLKHMSFGAIDNVFLRNSFKFYKKWENMLPIVRGASFSEEERRLSHELSSMAAYARELDYYNRRYNNMWCVRLHRQIKRILKRILNM